MCGDATKKKGGEAGFEVSDSMMDAALMIPTHYKAHSTCKQDILTCKRSQEPVLCHLPAQSLLDLHFHLPFALLT
jgi:hypothetical protein